MANKRIILYILLALGILLMGTGIWLLFNPSETVITETTDNLTFQEDFGFRGKQVSLEEANNLIGAKLPVPTYLPEGYTVQEIYAGVGDSTIIILISDVPIEKINREPPDKPKDYQIHLVKCEMSMYVSFESDLGMIGGNAKPTPSEMVFDEAEDSNCVWWTVQVDDKTASLYLIVKKEVADKEELIKIAQSVK